MKFEFLVVGNGQKFRSYGYFAMKQYQVQNIKPFPKREPEKELSNAVRSRSCKKAPSKSNQGKDRIILFSIRLRTALGSFSALTGPAPLARLEIALFYILFSIAGLSSKQIPTDIAVSLLFPMEIGEIQRTFKLAFTALDLDISLVSVHACQPEPADRTFEITQRQGSSFLP